MRFERITQPVPGSNALEPAKVHARLEGTDDDTWLTTAIDGAARMLEDLGQLALLTQSVRVRLVGWPSCGVIELPIGPVLSDDNLTVTADGDTVSDVELLTGRRGQVRLTVPVTAALSEAVILITHEAGFADAWADLPGDLRIAVLDQVAADYDARGAMDQRTTTTSAAMLRTAARYRGVRL